MAMGGFTGGDPILTSNELAGVVADGTVRFFLVPYRERGRSEPARWGTDHCVAVPQEEWGSAPPRPGGPFQLFDCAAVAGGM